jgi:hypothetical protein
MMHLVPAFSLLGFCVKNKRVRRKVRRDRRRLHHKSLHSPSQTPHQKLLNRREGKEGKKVAK